MNANLTAVIATERQQRYTAEATEYRCSRTARAAKVQRPTRRRSHRVSTFFKDLATASL